MAALQTIQQLTGIGDGLLVENINYSPSVLESLWTNNLCHPNNARNIGKILEFCQYWVEYAKV